MGVGQPGSCCLSGKQALTWAVLQPGTGPDSQVLTTCTVMLCSTRMPKAPQEKPWGQTCLFAEMCCREHC